MTELRVTVEADGGSRGNPGPAGYGAVVRETATGQVLLERYASLGVNTNNVAEYSGLIAGLTAAAELGATHVDVRMDSKLVVEQLSGRWQVKHPDMKVLAKRAKGVSTGDIAASGDLAMSISTRATGLLDRFKSLLTGRSSDTPSASQAQHLPHR